MDIQTTMFTRAQVSRSASRRSPRCTGFPRPRRRPRSTGARRSTTPTASAMWTGSGERLLATAQQPAPHHGVSLLRQHPGLRLLPARPGIRSLSRRRLLRPAPEPVGRAAGRPERRGFGRGHDPAGEIPTDDEIHDNAVAMWVPADPAPSVAVARSHLSFALARGPAVSSTARACVGTRLGRGGQPGQPRPNGVSKFMVEFSGGLARSLLASNPSWCCQLRAERSGLTVFEAVPDGVAGHWRAQFDFAVDGTAPVDLRAFLKSGGETLTETETFQNHPF